MSIDPFLTTLLIKVATSTAVNVVSKRTFDPKIRLVGHVLRTYSLVDPALDLLNAWRIGVKGDATLFFASGKLDVLRRNADKGLPCGSEKFVRKLERLTGRALHYRPRGRPRKETQEKG